MNIYPSNNFVSDNFAIYLFKNYIPSKKQVSEIKMHLLCKREDALVCSGTMGCI